MDNQNNATNLKKVAATTSSTKRKRIGCFGCFGYFLLIILIIAGGFFVFNTIRNACRKGTIEVRSRFDYEQKFSSG